MANAQVNLRYIANAKGGQNLVLNGFNFRVKSRRNNITYWECCKKTRACATTAAIFDGFLSSPLPQHDHPSEESKIAVQEIVERMKARVKSDCKSVHSLYKEELRVYSNREGLEVASTNPMFSSVQASLYHSRAANTPLLPRRPSDINLPPAYTLTSSQQQFLLAQHEKMLIFAKSDNLYHLSRADTYFCDGTFHVSPGVFYQLYSVHGFVNGKMCRLVYGLLPDKKQSTYLTFFNTIKEKAAEINIRLAPTTIFTDFEVVFQNAARISFACDLKGCPWFHALEKAETDDVRINNFADYVTEQWITGDREIWSHYATVGPRTTNHLEGWHGELKNVIRTFSSS